MKQSRHFRVLVAALLIVAVLSCQQAPFLTTTGPRTFNFTRDGGTQWFTFTCNRDWSVSSTESWVTLSPSSGSAADGEIKVTITCSANTTYDARSAVITIRLEDMSESITITQDTGIGLIVSPTSFDLTNAAHKVEIKVQKNVQYIISIDEDCTNWIRVGGTKALTNDMVTIVIAANETYDDREGEITFKQIDGPLTATVTFRQSHNEGLFIDNKTFEVAQEGGMITVEVDANVDYEVNPQDDWIHLVDTKGLVKTSFVLRVDVNELYRSRTGTVLVKQSNGSHIAMVTINQAPKVAVASVELDKTELFLKEGENAQLIATIYPDDATNKTVTWSTSDSSIATVDEKGNVVALKKGKASIVAKAEDKEGVCVLYINCIPDNEIWYTSTDNSRIDISFPSLANMPSLIGNSYTEGRGRLQFSESITEIGRDAFVAQTKLKSIVLPETVNALRISCFSSCTSLETITLPENLSIIEAWVFMNCKNIKELSIPDKVEDIAEGAIALCSSLQSIISKLATPDKRALIKEDTLIAVAAADINTYSIPEIVSSIGEYAISGYYSLFSIVLPSHLKRIGRYSFSFSGITSIIIPDTVTTVCDAAFKGCKNLQSISLPSELEVLEDEIFTACYALNDISIPETLQRIGKSVFNDCKALTTITLPEHVNEIDEAAFAGCSSLKSIIVRASIPPTLNYAHYPYTDQFYDTNNCPIYVPYESVEVYKKNGQWSYYFDRIYAIQPCAVDLGVFFP